MSNTSALELAEAVLGWWDIHGRKDLPWQQDPTPYRVWVSEIMLQQTQVSSVMRYFDPFMQRFPNVESLATADQDAVLAQWTGLGYYSRARNLHKAAREVTTRFEGKFPSDLLQLQTLPGVGRSTAGAIASLAFGQQAAILDGNVKRVLARVHAVEGPPAKASTIKTLWSLAEQHTPNSRFAHYTQAMMDLGATLCTRSNPQCLICPLNNRCTASHQGNPTAYPQKAARKDIPTKQVVMLIAQVPDGSILLEKRPPSGIWASLWSLPEFEDKTSLFNWLAQQHLGLRADLRVQEGFRHTFSHFHLDITPILAKLDSTGRVMDDNRQVWYKGGPPPGGFAAPVKRLLNSHLEEPTP